jgi:hypothetical protein
VGAALRARDLTEPLAAVGPAATLLFGVTGPEGPALAVAGEECRHLLVPLWRV